MSVDPAWIALAGTLLGGVGLKVTESWLGRAKQKSDDALVIRKELRDEVAGLKIEINSIETERDKYRNDYYDLREKHLTTQAELASALQKIKDMLEEATANIPKI